MSEFESPDLKMTANSHVFQSVCAQFLETVERVPDASAVLTATGSHTYGELHARSNAIRSHLASCGVKSGDLVPLILDRDLDLPAAIMAIFGLGASYLPLEAGDPVERHLRALEICQCRTILCTRANLNRLRQAMLTKGVKPLPDFVEVEDIMTLDAAFPAPEMPTAETLAYVLLTSGSTGRPKAVNVTHGNIANHIVSALEILEFTGKDRYLATTPLTFDPSISEIFLPLVCGGATVLRNRDLILDPKGLCRTMRATGVTVAAATPSTWATVIRTAGDDFPHLRAIVTHGEAISPSFSRTLAAQADRAMNLYGPTEATVWATGHRMTVDAPDPVSKTSAPIGKPLRNFSVRVTDGNGQDLAPNTPGELVLGGPSVAMGYRNNAEETAKVFFEENGVRYYRTGDLVLQRTDGVIEYMGRVDDQMAINGQRIEPGEIEAAILTHPWVKSCTVTWYSQPNDQRGILAATVAEPGQSITADGLRMYLASKLSRAMLPTRHLMLDSLPHLSSGKVDRNALRALLEKETAPTATPSALSQTEAKLVDFWQDLLQVPNITVQDDFFLVGGDSLSAVEMTMKAEEMFGVPVSVTDLFERPKLRDCAAAIDIALAQTSASPARSTSLIKSKAGNDETALFFVLADYGYAGRAGAKIRCPFFNLTVWNRDEGIFSSGTIEVLAARYLKDIRAQQPSGPYRLAGYSVGGILAFEIARQLAAAGETIATLFLLDPSPPTKLDVTGHGKITDGTGASGLHRILRRTPRVLKNMTFRGNYQRVNDALRKGDVEATREIDHATRRRALIYATGRMAVRYTAQPLDVPTTLVTGSDEVLYTWPQLLGQNTRIERIEGNHRGVFHPPVDAVWTDFLIDALANDETVQ